MDGGIPSWAYWGLFAGPMFVAALVGAAVVSLIWWLT